MVIGQKTGAQSLTCQVTLVTQLLGFSFFNCIRMWMIPRAVLVLEPDHSINAALLEMDLSV